MPPRKLNALPDGLQGDPSVGGLGLLLVPDLLPPIPPSIRVFSSESTLRMIKIDLFDHLAVQETLKSLLQHHSSKASIL